MRICFIGGTYYLGPVAVRLLSEAGHEVAVAHTGAHEHPAVEHLPHFHGLRADLLSRGGEVERWQPDVVVDTFAPIATAEAGREVASFAARTEAHLIAVSSIDVYQYCVEAGLGSGAGSELLPSHPLPIDETSPLRDQPIPGAPNEHDNAAMEVALQSVRNLQRVTVLRPGTIYGPFINSRERLLVDLIARGVRRLPLPDGGTQIFHRVAVERVARAIVAAVDRAPAGFWACNVVDPYDWTYAGLAAEIGRLLDWVWEPQRVAFDEAEHYWKMRQPVICADRRLREVLEVTEPDPREALAAAVAWLWAHREEVEQREAERRQ